MKRFLLILFASIPCFGYAASEVSFTTASFSYTSSQVGVHQYLSAGTVLFGISPAPGVTVRRIRVAPRLAGRNLIFPDAETFGLYEHTETIRNGVPATGKNSGCHVTVFWQMGRRSGKTDLLIKATPAVGG